MRLVVVGAALVWLAGAISGCVPVPPAPAPLGFSIARVDAADAAERALVGGVVGATLGTGLGALVATNPAAGAMIGAPTGALLGAAIGALTAQPLPAYVPVVVPEWALIPGFYDSWPPGNYVPPAAVQTPPPPPL